MRKSKYVKYIMCLGHFSSDFAQGTLSATLPFLIAAHSYSYTVAATLVLLANILGSVVQPLFGHIADRIDRPHIMTIGILMACGGMSAVGFIPGYTGICIAVVITGIGVAMFHPQGARMVNRASTEENIASALGIFSFGGNAGFTIGPITAAFILSRFGLKGTIIFMVPALIFCMIMIIAYRNYEPEIMNVKESEKGEKKEKDRWGAFGILCIYVTCRSIMFSAVGTFLILYLMESFHLAETTGSTFLSIYYGIAAMSALLGGKLADLKGKKFSMKASSFIYLAAMVTFTISGNVVLAIVSLIPLGVGISLGYSAMVSMGQNFLPNHIGLSSGVTLGLSVSIGGVLAPLLGKAGDLFGLHSIFMIMCIIAVIPVILAYVIPEK